MSRISQVTIDDVIADAPAVEPLDFPWLLDNPPALFVCAQGFEDRADAIAAALASSAIKIRYVVIVTLDSNTEVDQANGRRVSEILGPVALHPPLMVSGDQPDIGGRILKALGDESIFQNRENHILVDISVAANRAILRILACLLRSVCKLTIAYAEAEIYHPTRDAFSANESDWTADDALGTERGVEHICPSDEFLGEHLDAASNVVVLFPNFRHERSAAVVSHVDPALQVRPSDDVIWILGRPHLPEDLWRRDAMHRINRIPELAKVFEASTFDYREAWRSLETIYAERWESANLTLSPLGSKLQAIAVAIFCVRHSDVRVLLSIPQTYNSKQWSNGVRALWQVSFGDTQAFLERVLRAGTLRFEID